MEFFIPYARHYKPRLVFFYPIFTLAAAYIADNLCTKNGNSSLFKLKIRGFKSRAAYDGARTVVTYIDGNFRSPLGYIPILIDTFSSLFIQCYKKVLFLIRLYIMVIYLAGLYDWWENMSGGSLCSYLFLTYFESISENWD